VAQAWGQFNLEEGEHPQLEAIPSGLAITQLSACHSEIKVWSHRLGISSKSNYQSQDCV
jgi:hypothetical protein